MRKSKYSYLYDIARDHGISTTIVKNNRIELSHFCHPLAPIHSRSVFPNSPETPESFALACEGFTKWVCETYPELAKEILRTNDPFERKLPQ